MDELDVCALKLFLILLPAGVALAGEYATLASGSRLHVDRHEIEGGKVRLYNASGFIEMEATVVRSFEPDEPLAAPAGQPASAPAPSPAAAPLKLPVPAAQASASPQELADAAADKYGLPRRLVRSVMGAESGFERKAISPKGAIGLMQLMPETARDLGVDPHDPAQNVDGGTRYLRDLLLHYDFRLWHALAAYNAGPGAVNKSKDGIPPYHETIRYVNRIDQAFRQGSGQQQADGTR